MSAGWFGVANAPTFQVLCYFTSLRTIGSALIWQNSTLLLQTLTSTEMLGRVLGFEYSVARLSEAGIAFLAGHLEDMGYGKYEIASLAGTIGLTLFVCWSIYHTFGGGAANRKFEKTSVKKLEKEGIISAHDHIHTVV